jgi:uncharacterized UBP type Zn finger protein
MVEEYAHGVMNKGNTCYESAVLQFLFRYCTFTSAIYKILETESEFEVFNNFQQQTHALIHQNCF